MMSGFLPNAIQDCIKSNVGELINFYSASGGCINNGGKLSTTSGDYFIKWNSRVKFPGMFEAEKKGLELLNIRDGVRVPEVIQVGDTEDFSYLILEHLSASSMSEAYWQNFGYGLATIHRQTSEKFGLGDNNFIGSLPQINNTSKSWKEFFIKNRLLYQLEIAVGSGKVNTAEAKQMETAFRNLEQEIPDSRPALLHGDMWSGNLITGPNGEPCLIDPAVYYGHHEMDLAMSQLFGGFDQSYLEAYNEIIPLEKGYQSRFDLWNLYPLMVHVNLFGGGYISQVKHILRRF